MVAKKNVIRTEKSLPINKRARNFGARYKYKFGGRNAQFCDFAATRFIYEKKTANELKKD